MKKLLTIITLLASAAITTAQDIEPIIDSLDSSMITASRRSASRAGSKVVPLPELKTMVSATGEASIIKYVQTLPGISTGAEGSSAYYVRGGNMGSNLTSIDGISLYGGSHLLGMTSAYSQQIVSEATFRLGGFASDETNMTASHISIKTADGDFLKTSGHASVSNFMIGAGLSTPIVKNKLSVIASLRVSPLQWEFSAAKALSSNTLDSLNNVKSAIYDGFAKVKWKFSDKHAIALSGFHSMDAYGYKYGRGADEKMKWSNTIANLSDDIQVGDWHLHSNIAYNSFSSNQSIQKLMSSTQNELGIVSQLQEITVNWLVEKKILPYYHFQGGVKFRSAWFNPGSSVTYSGSDYFSSKSSPLADNKSNTLIGTAHTQFDINSEDIIELRTAFKYNFYSTDADMIGKRQWRANPEVNLFAKVFITHNIGLEGTYDKTVQYYHTLEGVPLGWSLDMVIPTDNKRPPEMSSQLYLGTFACFGLHNISVGTYRKYMKNLVYFSDATQLFSSAIAGWKDNIAVGTGTSEGIEFLYEKNGNILKYRIAYTLSDTDRRFKTVNKGLPFPSKFDRRHILNTSLSYTISRNAKRDIGINTFFTYQSGNWETVASGEYLCWPWDISSEGIPFDYFTSVNNWRMPDYIRFDLSCSIKIHSRYPQLLNIGIYNVLNRHNPFALTYDAESREWKQISLLPIMPSLSWSMEF